MIGLDTNVLVRYFAQDDPVQSPKATELIERRLSEDSPGFISVVAMVETVWVLDLAYKLEPPEIAATIENMLRADVFAVENEQEIFIAMLALKNESGSFPDALIAAIGARSGASRTLTFDRQAARLPGFDLLA